MRYRGEVTVFLTMILISIMSFLLVTVESVRDTGARLYLRMAVDSSMDSVMPSITESFGNDTGFWDWKRGRMGNWRKNLRLFLNLTGGQKTGIL